jgi:hypothetical protein
MALPTADETGDPRAYLLDRFRTDAQTLRERMLALEAGGSRPGPDAATSRAMAAACDAVVDLIAGLPPDGRGTGLTALRDLLPGLQTLSEHHAAQPAVRAVYAGAMTRIRDLIATTDG